jgi:hypothetical protein
MEPEGCSKGNGRRVRIQVQRGERLRNAHLHPGNHRGFRKRADPMAQSRAMTVTSRRSAPFVGLVIGLVVAACGSANPTPPPATATAGSSNPPVATASSQPSNQPTPAPPGSPAAFACDEPAAASSAPSPAADDPSAAAYDAIEQQMQDLRGLRATTKVERDVMDKPALCAFLTRKFRADNPAELVHGTEVLYKQLGLMPEDASLEDLYIELLTSQVAGLYDDKTKHMYVVSTNHDAGAIERFVYSHEYTHALTDQAFDLRKVVGADTDESDRTLARSALIEGDATLAMTLWAQNNLSPQELLQAAAAADPASQAVLDRMPAILKDPLLFPYTNGLQLALGGYTSGGGYAGVDDLYRNPPDSTEQVLHPEKLESREAPVEVAVPEDLAARLGSGWKVSLQDTFGELLLGIILKDAGAAASTDAAGGWGGDRVALLEGPNGETAVVLDTAWDTDSDAAEFETAVGSLTSKLTAAGESASVLRPDPKRVVVISAESPETMGKVANVLGLAG